MIHLESFLFRKTLDLRGADGDRSRTDKFKQFGETLIPPPDLPLPTFQIHCILPKTKRHLCIYRFSKLPCLLKGRGSCCESALPEEKLCYSDVSQTKSFVSSVCLCLCWPSRSHHGSFGSKGWAGNRCSWMLGSHKLASPQEKQTGRN